MNEVIEDCCFPSLVHPISDQLRFEIMGSGCAEGNRYGCRDCAYFLKVHKRKNREIWNYNLAKYCDLRANA